MGGAGGAVVAVGGLADDAAAEGGVGGGPGGVGRCGGIGGADVTDLRCGLCGGAGGVFPDRVALGPGGVVGESDGVAGDLAGGAGAEPVRTRTPACWRWAPSRHLPSLPAMWT